MMPAKFFTSTTKLEDLPKYDRPQVAMVGRSNVGKSSLINHLMQQKALARVSAAPGRTKTINLYEIDRRYFLVDLPGYGYAKASKDKRSAFATMIADYLTNTPQLQVVCVVIDAYVGPTELDHEMFQLLHSLGKRMIIIVNKIDKLSKGEAASLILKLSAEYADAQFIPHSIETDKHRGAILEAIEVALRATK